MATALLIIYVATYVDVQPSSINQGIALIRQYRQASRAEAGSLGIDVVQETGRPSRFVIVEAWKDQASFDAHEMAGSTAQFRASLKTIHNSPYDQRVHQGFAIGPTPPAAGDAFAVVTHVDVPPPRRDETEILLKRLAEDSRKDEGNVRYDIYQQNARTNHFTIFAAWKDAKAFDSHEMKPHTRQFRDAMGPMLGALYDERQYKPLN